MKQDLKKLFENHWVALSRQVTAERARMGGIILGDDVGPGKDSAETKSQPRYPRSVVKKLAGG
jgi:hypothetical protein